MCFYLTKCICIYTIPSIITTLYRAQNYTFFWYLQIYSPETIVFLQNTLPCLRLGVFLGVLIFVYKLVPIHQLSVILRSRLCQMSAVLTYETSVVGEHPNTSVWILNLGNHIDITIRVENLQPLNIRLYNSIYSSKLFERPMLHHIKKPLIVKKIGTPEKKLINSPNMGMLSIFKCANVCPYSTWNAANRRIRLRQSLLPPLHG